MITKIMSMGYKSLARNLIEFDRTGSVPMMIDVSRLNNGRGITETLFQHKAVYHKICYLKFNNKTLERVQKKIPIKPAPKKTKRLSEVLKDEPNIKFLFCGQVSDDKLHRASTPNIDSINGYENVLKSFVTHLC